MYLPGFIYELLPATYLAGSALCLSNLDVPGPGAFSAALLGAAGLLTSYWRYQARWSRVAP